MNNPTSALASMQMQGESSRQVADQSIGG